jgi:hypothetical protein
VGFICFTSAQTEAELTLGIRLWMMRLSKLKWSSVSAGMIGVTASEPASTTDAKSATAPSRPRLGLELRQWERLHHDIDELVGDGDHFDHLLTFENGFRCPACAARYFWPVMHCQDCGYQTPLTAGTVSQDTRQAPRCVGGIS